MADTYVASRKCRIDGKSFGAGERINDVSAARLKQLDGRIVEKVAPAKKKTTEKKTPEKKESTDSNKSGAGAGDASK